MGKCTVRQFSTENTVRGGKNFKVEYTVPPLKHMRQTSLVLFSESSESEMVGVGRNEKQERKGNS